jgi:hypothetical protein
MAVAAQVELHSSANILTDQTSLRFKVGIQNLLDIIERIAVIKRCRLVEQPIHPCMDFDLYNVPNLGMRIDGTPAAVTGVVNHDCLPLA